MMRRENLFICGNHLGLSSDLGDCCLTLVCTEEVVACAPRPTCAPPLMTTSLLEASLQEFGHGTQSQWVGVYPSRIFLDSYEGLPS